MGYDYQVQYKPGVDNIVAAQLSRQSTIQGCYRAITTVSCNLLKEIQDTWARDPKLQKIIQQLISANPGAPKYYTWNQQQLKRKGKLVAGADPSLKKKIILLWHEGGVRGHLGIYVTYQELKSVL